MTAILQLPRLAVEFALSTNEAWRDTITFQKGGAATGYAANGNTGNGTLGTITTSDGAPIGDCSLVVTALDGADAIYLVTGPSGERLGIGRTGVPFTAAGLTFTLAQGSTHFAVTDEFTLVVLPTPIDITGIVFRMQVRETPSREEFYLAVSTDEGGLINGGLAGTLAIAVPQSVVATMPVGTTVLDIVGTGDGLPRVVVDATLDLSLGTTRL